MRNAVADAPIPITADAIAPRRSHVRRVRTVIAASAIEICRNVSASAKRSCGRNFASDF
jgi:hypothetical protein